MKAAEEGRVNPAGVALLMLMAFFVIGSYEFCRSPIESIFLDRHGSEALPKAYLAIAVGVAITVFIYNSVSSRVHLLLLMAIASAFSSVLLVGLLVAHRSGVPGTAYLLYVFKDVYIVVLVETFWSFANAAFPIKSARWLYGLFCAAGSLGGAAANFVVSQIVTGTGSEQTLFIVPPILIVVAIGTALAPRIDVAQTVPKKTADGGFSVLKNSRYLLTMLALIATTQIVITLIDFLFGQGAANAYPVKDDRTAVMATIYGSINIISTVLQLATGIVLKFAGVGRTLIAIPLILGGALVTFAVNPQFFFLSAAKIMSKCLDYSLFRASKEILYIPLTYPEKTQGKAFVDIFTYRVAKGGASLLLLGLVAAGFTNGALPLTVAGIAIWIVLTFVIVKKYRARSHGQS